ncbi:biopolymer transporter ExbD [Nitratireductor mangrovi]|uniref:Biopolymer transporter ExbD n=1 Tax=Nitratireductor mangrovi TaxID=2599600 RepID=A0A5B8L3U1_9HYPH|nr:biopolymer transporter ExbD [Nitratireductor mangrovi]QDZ02564.1 biopolymer transporter ExbD [Nitratireductor mangrovi]
MRIEAVARRRRPVSVTSLIDVIFLLLLFFMLSSTFTRFSEVEITGGRAGADAAGPAPDVIIRLAGEDWLINGAGFAATDATAELTRLETAGARTAVILVRGEITSQDLVSAIEAIRRDTALSLSVAR